MVSWKTWKRSKVILLLSRNTDDVVLEYNKQMVSDIPSFLLVSEIKDMLCLLFASSFGEPFEWPTTKPLLYLWPE
ncbi:hypothetical protein GN956_G101 [Arapaima gigas]